MILVIILFLESGLNVKKQSLQKEEKKNLLKKYIIQLMKTIKLKKIDIIII
jgi:hypothetical protein